MSATEVEMSGQNKCWFHENKSKYANLILAMVLTEDLSNLRLSGNFIFFLLHCVNYSGLSWKKVRYPPIIYFICKINHFLFLIERKLYILILWTASIPLIEYLKFSFILEENAKQFLHIHVIFLFWLVNIFEN